MSSINLLDTTNVQRTPFSSRASTVSEIQTTPGIFTFNLTWDDLNDSTLKPKISSPMSSFYLVRNPRYTNQGKFLKLSDFLAIGKDKGLSGVMIIIENAAFMAKSLGIDIVGSVTTALIDAGYDNQTTKEVMIQSKDSNVLVKLKQQRTKCKLVYTLPSDIGDASASSLVDMKKFADAVVVDKTSVFPTSKNFILRQTSLVKDLQAAGLAVYAQVFQNEFVSQPWDFFGDETVEINNYVQLVNISGIITDFPRTVRRYKKKLLYRFRKGHAQLHAVCSGWLPCTVTPEHYCPAASSGANADTGCIRRDGATASSCCVKKYVWWCLRGRPNSWRATF
uniref:glycerophosphodiester phosphodiesterase n=1 Tax=Arundo donax TaxID=35708 RepID=A0A0A8ZJM3_ARUDO